MVNLKDISIKAIAHPDDIKAYDALNKSVVVHNIINWVASKQNSYLLKTSVMGSSFRVTKQYMPKLYSLLTEVCYTLDYSPIPNIYMSHSNEFEIDVYAGSTPLVIIPDYIVDDFDENMLRFSIGRSVARLKSEHCQLKTLSKVVATSSSLLPSIPGLNEALFASLCDWSRKSCYTEDRWGLLACQDIYSAERVLMRITGMPLKYLDSTCVLEYIEACTQKNAIATVSQYLKTIMRTEPWNNDRIVQLYKWYKSGNYDDIIEACV